jgi:hypothetical protein
VRIRNKRRMVLRNNISLFPFALLYYLSHHFIIIHILFLRSVDAHSLDVQTLLYYLIHIRIILLS